MMRERILFTKANIQYQYHKTITSGRLPEGITHQAGSGESMEPMEEVPLKELHESELKRLVRG